MEQDNTQVSANLLLEALCVRQRFVTFSTKGLKCSKLIHKGVTLTPPAVGVPPYIFNILDFVIVASNSSLWYYSNVAVRVQFLPERSLHEVQ